MRKVVAKLIAGITGVVAVVLIAAIAAQMMGRENVLERITQWPDIEIITIEGDEFSTAQLILDAPILFNYFNTECVFCQSEILEIANHAELQKSATLVFISDEPPDVIKRFRRNYSLDANPNFLFLVDTDSKVKEYYRIRSVPATHLYTSNGELVEFFRGLISAETLYSHILTILDHEE